MNTETSFYRSPTYYELAAPPELDWRPFRDKSYLEYRREWDSRGAQGLAGDFPLHLDIDPTNRCNLSCTMCPRTVYLQEGNPNWAPGGLSDMDMSLFRRIIESSAPLGLKSVKLNFLGEPLLYPELPEMVRLSSSLGLYVMINTNATLLDEDMSERLLLSGLTDIFFSFDSPYPEAYESIRRGASYEKTLANIKSFMAVKDKLGKYEVQTRASMVLPENLEDHPRIKADYLKLFRDLKVAEIGFGLPTVVGRDYGPLNVRDDFTCPDLFRRLFIFHDGACGPCCGDWERRLIVGDANTQSIQDIWNSEEYQLLRVCHQNKAYKKIKACRSCSVPYLSGLEL
ncbi:MAG: radical SAM protein [Deltaproteobacteria bacterium]|nr:radical SAM protein [Deltaproteobacteria bacterium]